MVPAPWRPGRREGTRSARAGALFLRQQAPHLDVELLLRLAEKFAAPGTWKTGVNASHQTPAIYEKSGRPGIPVDQLREFGVRLVRVAAQQHRELQPVLLRKRTQASRILELIGLFERKRNNLQ